MHCSMYIVFLFSYITATAPPASVSHLAFFPWLGWFVEVDSRVSGVLYIVSDKIHLPHFFHSQSINALVGGSNLVPTRKAKLFVVYCCLFRVQIGPSTTQTFIETETIMVKLDKLDTFLNNLCVLLVRKSSIIMPKDKKVVTSYDFLWLISLWL